MLFKITAIFASFGPTHPISANEHCHTNCCLGQPMSCSILQTCPHCKLNPGFMALEAHTVLITVAQCSPVTDLLFLENNFLQIQQKVICLLLKLLFQLLSFLFCSLLQLSHFRHCLLLKLLYNSVGLAATMFIPFLEQFYLPDLSFYSSIKQPYAIRFIE